MHISVLRYQADKNLMALVSLFIPLPHPAFRNDTIFFAREVDCKNLLESETRRNSKDYLVWDFLL